jgi:hypothetical protein
VLNTEQWPGQLLLANSSPTKQGALMTDSQSRKDEESTASKTGEPAKKAPKPAKPRKVEKRQKGRKG